MRRSAGIPRSSRRSGRRRETVKLVTASRALYAANLQCARSFNAHFGPLLQTLPALGQMAVFALGGWMAAQGSITVAPLLPSGPA